MVLEFQGKDLEYRCRVWGLGFRDIHRGFRGHIVTGAESYRGHLSKQYVQC